MAVEAERKAIVRVVVADDHALTRRELARAVDQHPQLIVVGQAADGEEALALTRALDPDVVLMDIRMPGQDGLQTARCIRAECRAAVVLISSFNDDQFAAAAFDAGAAAYVAKSDSEAALLAAILQAAPAVAAGDR
jgi:DNA-binding NarL/FixJ family response regulator